MRDAAPLTRLADLVERLGRLAQGERYAEGLPPVQWQALGYLARANRFSRHPTALGLYLGATKGTVSQTVMALVRKGLVRKEADPADRRAVTLDLTARGRALLARRPAGALADALAELPAPARARLARTLAQVLEAMLARRQGRMFGQCAGCRFFRRGGARAQAAGPHRCGLLDVPLSDDDAEKICVEFERAA
jgi:DNA-binding MarR family transcriptional regulator